MRRVEVGRAVEVAAPVLGALAVAAAAFGRGPGPVPVAAGYAVVSLAAGLALLASATASRRVAPAEGPWRIVAVAAGLELCGAVLVAAEVASGDPHGQAHLVHAAAHAAALALVLAAAVSFGSSNPVRRGLTAMDGLLVGGAGALVVWMAALGEGARLGPFATTTSTGLLMAALLLDLAVGMAAVLALAWRDRASPARGTLRALALATIPMAASDVVALAAGRAGALPRAAGIAAGLLAVILAAQSARAPDPGDEDVERVGTPGWVLLAPVAVVVTSLAAVAVSATSGGLPWSTGLTAAGLGVGLVVRHVLIALEEQMVVSAMESRINDHTSTLEQRERYFRALVQNSSDAVMVLSADGEILDASESVQQVLGWKASVLRGRHLTDLVVDDQHRLMADAARAILAHPEYSHVVECRVRGGDGRERDTESTVANLVDDPVVGAIVCNIRDVTDRKQLERELATAAYTDPLTGLANRSTLLRELEASMSAAHDTARVVGLVFLDLDGFKQVNDTLGHQAGDDLLCEVATRVAGAVRPNDVVARLGGDEFAVMLPGLEDPADLAVVTNRLIHQVNRPFTTGGRRVPVRASVGAAVSGTYATTASDLLRNADLAMYDGKGKGKGRVAFFRPELVVALEERVELEAELRRALDQEEFVLYYQPLVDLATDRIGSVEALIRWRHPRRGLLTPAAFIALAEESDIIVEIDRWSLQAACRDLARLSVNARAADLSVAVNVSGRHLASADLVNDVAASMITTSMEPARLTLEVTETLLFDETPEVISCLARLRRLGVKVAIDDFGTGYSSLSKLSRLPVDQLKLDGSFVWEMAESSAARAVVATVLALGRSLDVEVVAEGVETAEQLHQLRSMGFTVGQGFHLMKPIPFEELEAIMAVEAQIGRIL